MSSASRLKASEKQEYCKKISSVLKKYYKGNLPESDRPVLETMMYAICLEDVSFEVAEQGFLKFLKAFHDDLNEIRVSSITELENSLSELPNAQWRALRIRSLLQFVFEQEYKFEFDGIKRKTLDGAASDLEEIPNLSSFVRDYTLQTVIGGHAIPIDQVTFDLAVWLGLADSSWTLDEASASIKAALRKADAPHFCYLLRSLATDAKYQAMIHEQAQTAPEDGYDLTKAVNRLKVLFGEKPEKTEKLSKAEKDAPAETVKAAPKKKKSVEKAAASEKTNSKNSKKAPPQSEKKSPSKKTATKS